MRPATILIVEDNPDSLQLIKYLLAAFGYAVISASNGEEGVASARDRRPDLILMDLQLPAVDGFEAARRIHDTSETKHIPIVAVTASAMVGERNRILSSGFDGYICKPITPETIVAQVESFLPRPRAS